MKRIIKNPIFTFIVGIIITSGVVGALAYTYQASDISYTTSHNNQVTNVEQAVNDLYGKLPYYVEYYQGSTYLGKSAHKYGEVSTLISMLPTNTASCTYSGWSDTQGGSKNYDSGASVTNLATPGNTKTLYAFGEQTFTGYVLGNNRNFEAHYSNGEIDKCYWTGNISGQNPGTNLNGNGTKCDSFTICTSSDVMYPLKYMCNSSLPYTNYQASELPSTKTIPC